MAPRVSILIPCYNAEQWVTAAIESALAQSWRDREIIAVDDGSTDGTLAVLESLADRGVLVIPQSNKGASAARNRALSEARGDFIQFLDADDLLDPNKLAVQISALASANARKVAACRWGRFATDPARAIFKPEAVWCTQSARDFLVACALKELMFPPSAWLIPRALVDEAGSWDERLSMNDDGEYMARVLAAGEGIVFCDEAAVYYRSGNYASYGSRRSEQAAISDLLAWDSIVQTLERLASDQDVALAAATGYERIAARYYGTFPKVVAEAEAQARRLGGGQYHVGGGIVFRAASRMLGWKSALRLRQAKTMVVGRMSSHRAS